MSFDFEISKKLKNDLEKISKKDPQLSLALSKKIK